MGHWKNECPQKALFLDNERATDSIAATTHWTHSEGPQDNTTPLFWADDDDEQVIDLGAAWPGEEVGEPTFTYMTLEEPFEELEAMTTPPVDAPTAASPPSLAAGTSIPVTGMLEVRGSLTVLADGTMGLQLLPTATAQQLHSTLSAHQTPGPLHSPPNAAVSAAHQPPYTAYSTPHAAAPAATPAAAAHSLAAASVPSERSQSPTSNFRRDMAGNAVYDMRQILGVEVIVDESRKATKGKKKELRRDTAEETTWFFETVEADNENESSSDQHNSKGHAYAASPPQPVKSSHHRAVTNQPTLLPDSGAVSNLIGSLRAKEFSKAAKSLGHAVTWTKLTQPRIVSGVGGTGSACQYLLTVTGRVGPKTVLRYRAPVISGSSEGVPALLGLQEQTAARAILLPQSKKLMILPPQNSEQDIQFPEKTACIHLEVAPSGHLLIPFLRASQTGQHTSLGKHDDSRTNKNHQCHWGTSSKSTAAAALVACAALTTSYPPLHARPSHMQPPIYQTTAEKQKKVMFDLSHPPEAELTFVSSKSADARRRSTRMKEIEQQLSQMTIPLGHRRTNVFGESAQGRTFEPRSVLYGAYTRRGQGITRSCEDVATLRLLHQLADT
eukprot:6492680-Amphidinium_carterae.4